MAYDSLTSVSPKHLVAIPSILLMWIELRSSPIISLERIAVGLEEVAY